MLYLLIVFDLKGGSSSWFPLLQPASPCRKRRGNCNVSYAELHRGRNRGFESGLFLGYVTTVRLSLVCWPEVYNKAAISGALTVSPITGPSVVLLTSANSMKGTFPLGIVVVGRIEDIINGRAVILSPSDIRVDMGPQNVAKLNVQFQRWRVRYKLRVVDIKSLAVVYVKVCIDRKFYDMPCHVMLTSREVPVGSTFFGQYRLPPKP